MPEVVTEPVVIPALPEPTDFEKWEKLPEDQQKPSDTSAAEAETPAAAGETAPASEPEISQEDDDEDDDGDDDGVKPKSKQRGINRKFHKFSEEIRDLRAQLAAVKPAAATEVKPAVAALAPVDPNEPKEADFETYPDFVRATTRYELARANAELAAQAQQAEAGKLWTARETEAKARLADYKSVVTESQLPVSIAMRDTMLSSERGPEVAYYLGKNPAECARIFALAPLAQARELGKIEAGLTAIPDTKKPAAAVSAAPRPVKPVTGGGNAAPDAEPDPKDFLKWNKWRDRQDALRDA